MMLPQCLKSNNRYRDVIANSEGNTLYVTDTAGMYKKMMVQSLIL